MRTQRSIASYGSALGLSVLTVLLALFTTPVRLRWLGTDAMGLYRVLLDALGYLTLLDWGIAAALASLFATHLAHGNAADVRGLLRLGLLSLAKSTGLKIVVGAGLCVWLGLTLEVPPELRADFAVACVVGVASAMFTPANAFRSLLEGSQRGYVVQIVLAVQTTVTTALSVWFAVLGWGVTGQVGALACGVGVGQALVVATSLRRFPGALERPVAATGADEGHRAALRRLNGPAFVVELTGTIAILSDNIIVALFVSPALVTAFFLTQRLASVAQAQLQALGSASWAGLAEVYETGDLELFNQRALELTRLVAIASCALLIPTAVFNRGFMTLWVGAALYGGTAVTVAAALVAFCQAVISLWGFLFYAAGLLPQIQRISVATVAVNLIASVTLARTFGMVGPLLGTLLGFGTVSFWALPRLMRQTFGLSPASLASALARPIILGVLVTIGAVWMNRLQLSQSWVGWLLSMGVTSSGYLALAWGVVLSHQERQAWRQRVATALPWGAR